MNDINIVPQPVETKKTEDEFKLDKKTCILSYVDDKAANMLNFYLEKLYGFTLPIKKTVQKDEKYIFFSSIHAESNYPDEGYSLKILKNKIDIASKTGAGAFYGLINNASIIFVFLKLQIISSQVKQSWNYLYHHDKLLSLLFENHFHWHQVCA